MTLIRFFVPERPFAKQRPRFGRGRTYTPAQTVAAEAAVRHYARRALPAGFVPLAGPVRVALEFRFARPRRQKPEVRASPWHAIRSDIDNLEKLVFDALNPPRSTDPDQSWPGIWCDDAQVASKCSLKLWADEEHPEGTTVKVEAL